MHVFKRVQTNFRFKLFKIKNFLQLNQLADLHEWMRAMRKVLKIDFTLGIITNWN